MSRIVGGQPIGTAVSLPLDRMGAIEGMCKGDSVVTLDRHGHVFVNRVKPGLLSGIISQPKPRFYTGYLYTVDAGSRSSRCTADHRWLVRYADRKVKDLVVYVMKRGRSYRVGWCQLFDAVGTNHLALRSRIENAEATWILSVHKDRGEASLQESFIALKYQLPLVMFNENKSGTTRHYTQKALNAHFERIFNDGIDLEHHAKRCLEDFGRCFDHPYYANRGDYARRGRTTDSLVETCNLLPGLMTLPLYIGERTVSWAHFTLAAKAVQAHRVYTINVSKTGLYVADGILTSAAEGI